MQPDPILREQRYSGVQSFKQIKQFATCNSTNVIYFFICSCGLRYRKSHNTCKNLHYWMCLCNQMQRWEISCWTFHGVETYIVRSIILYTVIKCIQKPHRGNEDNAVLRRERHFFFNQKTLKPQGLNEELCLQCLFFVSLLVSLCMILHWLLYSTCCCTYRWDFL